jgi:hypothetical protein
VQDDRQAAHRRPRFGAPSLSACGLSHSCLVVSLAGC